MTIPRHDHDDHVHRAAGGSPRLVAQPEISDVADIASLPAGSVLLCRVGEIFWKATTTSGVWLAAGYTDTWTDAEVSEWAPLTVIHRGGAS